MADLKISQLTNYTTPLSADVLPIVDTANTTTKKVTVANLFNILSSLFTIKDSSDTTKKLAFNVSGITTGTTRTITVPDSDLTVVGTSTNQTLTNKTISTGTKINASGSDGTGAMYYRDSSGNLTNLALGSNLQILQSNGTSPQWVANPSATAATYSTLGVVQGNTDAATSGLTISSGVISVNSGTGANQIVKLNGSSQLPAVDGSLLTGVSGFLTSGAPGTTTTNTTATVLTYSLAGGTLNTNKGVRIRVAVTVAISGTTSNATYTVAYGGTTLATFGSSHSSTPTYTVAIVSDITLMGSGATNTQHASAITTFTTISGSGGGEAVATAQQNTAAIDSTAAQNITISCTAGANTTGTLVDYFIQKIA